MRNVVNVVCAVTRVQRESIWTEGFNPDYERYPTDRPTGWLAGWIANKKGRHEYAFNISHRERAIISAVSSAIGVTESTGVQLSAISQSRHFSKAKTMTDRNIISR